MVATPRSLLPSPVTLSPAWTVNGGNLRRLAIRIAVIHDLAARRTRATAALRDAARRREYAARTGCYLRALAPVVYCEGDGPTGRAALGALCYSAARALRSVCPPLARLVRSLAARVSE